MANPIPPRWVWAGAALSYMLALGACAGSSQALQPATGAPAVSTAPGAAHVDRLALDRAAWQRLIAAPGAPGVDYNPRQIMVVYADGSLPPIAPGLAAASGAAAAMPNSSLRQNKQYEPLTDAIAARYGLTIQQQVYTGELNLASFNAPPESDPGAILARLRTEFAPQVAYALFSPRHKAQYTPNDPDYKEGASGVLWDRWRIRCGEAWDVTLGDPAVWVAVVDTGVRRTHEELQAQVIDTQVELPSAYCDVVNNDKITEDGVGHGTFIAGVIAAQGDNGRTLIGVAPRCRVLPVKISNDGYADSPDTIAGCLLAMQLGAKVVNLSFGGYDYVPAESAMADQLTAGGVLFVCAAANDGIYDAAYPAGYDNALSVGATGLNDARASFSNWGPTTDIAAPGDFLKSCSYYSDVDYNGSGTGTSFAAPMVSAAAALIWSYRPELTVAQVRTALEQHGPVAPSFATPIVRLDIKAALNSVAPPVTPTVGGITVAADSVYGAVPAALQINVALAQPQHVERATYTLDVLPYNDGGADDITIESSAGPNFAAQIDAPAAGNLTAQLRAEYISPTDTSGIPVAARVFVFNQRGDANADGVVDYADLLAYDLLLGVMRGAPGYIPFYDSDLDGVINEADASAVGYFFNGIPPWPKVLSVAPAGGYYGEPVTFSAGIEGQEPLSYAWDFGGGAVPNTSSAVAPAVALGAQGAYNATLKLSNALGQDTYHFTLNVGPRPRPTAAFSATPRTGQPPLAVAFDAGASTAPGGSITQYQWSWDGDATWEAGSALPTSAHTFDTLGAYTVRLRVTDDLAQTAEATQTIRVSDQPSLSQWQEYELGPWGGKHSDDDPRLCQTSVDGRTALLWLSEDANRDLTLHLAWAKVAQPASLADWKIYTLFEHRNMQAPLAIMSYGSNVAYTYILEYQGFYAEHDGVSATQTGMRTGTSYSTPYSLALVGGKPAVFMRTSTPEAPFGGWFYASTDAAHPAAPEDWTLCQINQTNTNFGDAIQLAGIGGLPYLQGQGILGSDDQRMLLYAPSSSPQLNSWVWYGLGDLERTYNYYGTFLLHNPQPALLYGARADAVDAATKICYSRATCAAPDSGAQWQSYDIMSGYDLFPISATLVSGMPVCLATVSGGATEQAQLWLANAADPLAASDWSMVEMPDSVDKLNRRVVAHGDLPAMLATIRGSSDADYRLVYRYPEY
jgi:PKD repeat protein